MAGAWPWTLTPFKCRGHERVELYLYCPYGPYGLYRISVPVQGWPLPLPYYCHDCAIYTQAFRSFSSIAGYRIVHSSLFAATVLFSQGKIAGYSCYRKVNVASFLFMLWSLVGKTAVYIHKFLGKKLDVCLFLASRSGQFHDRERTAIGIFYVMIILRR